MIEWTKLPKKEFKEELFELAHELHDKILSTSGSEEGLNVLLTVIATTIGSISYANWNVMMKTACSEYVDPNETEIRDITIELMNALNKFREFSMISNSKYLNFVKEGDIN